MKVFSRLAVALAALALVAPMDATALTREELAEVRSLVEKGDADALREFIVANPWVLDNTAIGQELREFMEATPQQTVFASIGFTNPLPQGLRETVEAAKTDPSMY